MNSLVEAYQLRLLTELIENAMGSLNTGYDKYGAEINIEGTKRELREHQRQLNHRIEMLLFSK
jgi:hypothetical protein